MGREASEDVPVLLPDDDDRRALVQNGGRQLGEALPVLPGWEKHVGVEPMISSIIDTTLVSIDTREVV